jgi:hypothetical protein
MMKKPMAWGQAEYLYSMETRQASEMLCTDLYGKG